MANLGGVDTFIARFVTDSGAIGGNGCLDDGRCFGFVTPSGWEGIEILSVRSYPATVVNREHWALIWRASRLTLSAGGFYVDIEPEFRRDTLRTNSPFLTDDGTIVVDALSVSGPLVRTLAD